jgi:hypothetical protein
MERLQSMVARIGNDGHLPVLYVVPQIRACFLQLFGPGTALNGFVGVSMRNLNIGGVPCLVVFAPHPSPRAWQREGGYAAFIDGLVSLRGEVCACVSV